MRTRVVFNPTARRGRAARLQSRLRAMAPNEGVAVSETAGAARQLAREAVERGVDTVVAAGGDGTVDEVVNGIGDVPGGFDRTRLGVLPCGSVNLLAHEYGMPAKLESAWAVIESRQEQLVDLPRVECIGAEGWIRRYFTHAGSGGMDARAIQLLDRALRQKIGPLAFMWAGLRAICGRQHSVTVTLGQTVVSGEWVLIGNGKCYGGPFQYFPRAEVDDGRLDIAVLPKVRRLRLIPGAIRTWARGAPAPGHFTTFQAESFTLTGEPGAVFHVGGEIVGTMPARFSVLPRRLRLIVP